MKRFSILILIISSLGILFACENKTKNNTTTKTKSTVVTSGVDLYQTHCDGCHGDEIKKRGLSKDEILNAIKNGKKGMKANIVKGNDAEKVAEYLAK